LIKRTVTKCEGCPFFSKSLVSLLASRGNPHAGDCLAPGITKDGEVTQAKSLPVEDKRTLPRWCPLRIGDIVVTIGNRGTA
jgi:hypothetical protein